MPSDAKKKQAAKKKELAKARASGKKVTSSKPQANGAGDKEVPKNNVVNGGVTNGKVEISEEGKLNTCTLDVD